MKETKFRAVVKETNEVFPVITIWENSVCLNLTSSDKEWNAQVFSSDEIELLQFTSLKDKNGKEIYERDIVNCNYMGFTVFNAQVKLGEYTQDGSGGEYSGTKCIGFYAEAINKDQTDEWGIKVISDYLETTSLLSFDEIEVIGNIYENPELLEGDSV